MIKFTGMKASELRIGNLFYISVNDGPRVVFGVRESWIFYFEEGELKHREVNQQYCQPIPLTEEWLLKFGFIKLHHFGNYEFTKLLNDPVLGEDKSDLSIEVVHRSDDNRYIVRFVLEPDYYDYEPSSVNYHSLQHIEYVHQLQNLYFALTGEELLLTHVL
jgi:hypothetical protein